MHLPWKKTKGNRISRIVADLQPSPRAATLFVETGFPTSVVDIIVKNRGRLRRQTSFKKPQNFHVDVDVDPHPLAPPPTPLLSPDHSSSHFAAKRSPSSATATPQINNNFTMPLPNLKKNLQRDSLNRPELRFVMAAVKIILVVLLAFYTNKNFVVGITLAAFLLFFLDIFGKLAVGFFKIRSNSQVGMGYFAGKISERRQEQEQRKSSDDGGKGIIEFEVIHEEEEEEEEEKENTAKLSSYEESEIQVTERKNLVSSSTDGIIGTENEEMGEGINGGLHGEILSREKRWGCMDSVEDENEEEQKTGEMVTKKNQRSRSAKLKEKLLKKLIPKKLRSGKKMKNIDNNDKSLIHIRTSYSSETSADYHHHHHHKQDMKNQNEYEKENGSISSSSSSTTCSSEEYEVGVAEENMKFAEKEEGEVVIGIGIGNKMKNAEKKSIVCIIIILTILTGLMKGRFVALVLALLASFICKFINLLKIKWNSISG